MSDMGEMFGAMREATKAHRAEMLASADTTGWLQLSPYHYRRDFLGERIDWWPSGGKAQFRGKMVYGHRRVNALIAKLKERDAACTHNAADSCDCGRRQRKEIRP